MTNLPSDFVMVRARARPMSPEERRTHILDAVIPLLRHNGRDVSSREMAQAAGVAEGTLFRAFGDKESIIAAAIERYFDPEPFRAALRAIDPNDRTESKVRQVLQLLRDRFQNVIGFMTALRGEAQPPPRGVEEREWVGIVAQLFRSDELGIPVETLAYYLRLLAFGSALPPITSTHVFTIDELLDLVTRGVLPAASSALSGTSVSSASPDGKKD